jgi:hypothetical protein
MSQMLYGLPAGKVCASISLISGTNPIPTPDDLRFPAFLLRRPLPPVAHLPIVSPPDCGGIETPCGSRGAERAGEGMSRFPVFHKAGRLELFRGRRALYVPVCSIPRQLGDLAAIRRASSRVGV